VSGQFFGLKKFFLLFLGLTLDQGGYLIGQWLGLDGFFRDLRRCGGLSGRCRLEPWLRHSNYLLGHPVSLLLILVTRLVYRELGLDRSGAQHSLQGLITPSRLLGEEWIPSRRMPGFSMIRSREAHGVTILYSIFSLGKRRHTMSPFF
jgi:hypothetical protein